MSENTTLVPPETRKRLVPELSKKPFSVDDVLDDTRDSSSPPQTDNLAPLMNLSVTFACGSSPPQTDNPAP